MRLCSISTLIVYEVLPRGPIVGGESIGSRPVQHSGAIKLWSTDPVLREQEQQTSGIASSGADIGSWLVSRGLRGASQEALLDGFCAKVVAANVSIDRMHLAQTALHPVYGALGFDWKRSGTSVLREQFAHVSVPRARWAKSPLYFMLKEGLAELRERLVPPQDPNRFPVLDEFRAEGATDYFALVIPFSSNFPEGGVDPINPPEGMAVSWTSDAPEGFSDGEIDLLRTLSLPLGLALKSAADRQTARDLLAVYLGEDAGSRVLSGEIQRGSVETINAVILYFDLAGFTKLSETAHGNVIISMLNDYFGSVVDVIEAHGGSVLKFMGDGLLAIFKAADRSNAPSSAVSATAELCETMADLNRRRASEGIPHTDFGVAIHAGDVMYGNIGAERRLDFTVIGPAVNATARMQGMCRQLEQKVILSSLVAEAVMHQRDDVVSLGRYMLRGLAVPQELFTLTGTI